MIICQLCIAKGLDVIECQHADEKSFAAHLLAAHNCRIVRKRDRGYEVEKFRLISQRVH